MKGLYATIMRRYSHNVEERPYTQQHLHSSDITTGLVPQRRKPRPTFGISLNELKAAISHRAERTYVVAETIR